MTIHRRASRWLATLFLIALIALAGCRTPTVTAPTPTTAPTATTVPEATATPTTFVSPLPTPTLSGQISPLPTPTSTSQSGAGTGESIELVILHSNDTWGYTLPCG